MPDLNIQFGQIPFWSICRFGERTKIEITVFAFICAKRFRSNQLADCSRSEIIQYTGLDKSQISTAIKNLIHYKWLEMRSKTSWFIPEIEPEKVDKLSTKKRQKVDELSTNEGAKKLTNYQQKVDDFTTKVDDSSTPSYKDSDLHTLQTTELNYIGEKSPKTKKTKTKKTPFPIPEDFEISEEMRSWAKAEVPGIDVEKEAKQFLNHYKSGNAKNPLAVNWNAKWKTWVWNAETFQNKSGVNNGKTQQFNTPTQTAAETIRNRPYYKPPNVGG